MNGQSHHKKEERALFLQHKHSDCTTNHFPDLVIDRYGAIGFFSPEA